MPFTKLDEGILKSSIMAEKSDTFKVFIAFLASCGPDGIARVSAIFISAACHLSQKTVDHAIEILEAPDPHSRSEAEDGRRIRRVDGGFFVINYEKYRAFSYSEKPESVRKREYRQRTKDEEQAFDAWWSLYPRKIAKQDAIKAYSVAIKAGAKPEDLLKAVEGYRAELKKNGTEEQYTKHPATFLRADRWRDYVGRPAPIQIGASKKQDHTPEYWAEARRLRAKGLEGQALTEALAEFESKKE